jgi:hypothetical protein
MKKGVKLTLQDLLARKLQKDQDRTEYKSVYLENFGGELEIKKLPLPKFLGIIDEISENTSAGQSMRVQMDLIYECCPLLHNPELQQEYDCTEPTDIVGKVFDDNLTDIMTVVAAIFEFYGMNSEDIVGELKN